MKKRLDILVTERGLAESREKAKALIMAGQIYVDNQKAESPGTPSRRSAASNPVARACPTSAGAA